MKQLIYNVETGKTEVVEIDIEVQALLEESDENTKG